MVSSWIWICCNILQALPDIIPVADIAKLRHVRLYLKWQIFYKHYQCKMDISPIPNILQALSDQKALIFYTRYSTNTVRPKGPFLLWQTFSTLCQTKRAFSPLADISQALSDQNAIIFYTKYSTNTVRPKDLIFYTRYSTNTVKPKGPYLIPNTLQATVRPKGLYLLCQKDLISYGRYSTNTVIPTWCYLLWQIFYKHCHTKMVLSPMADILHCHTKMVLSPMADILQTLSHQHGVISNGWYSTLSYQNGVICYSRYSTNTVIPTWCYLQWQIFYTVTLKRSYHIWQIFYKHCHTNMILSHMADILQTLSHQKGCMSYGRHSTSTVTPKMSCPLSGHRTEFPSDNDVSSQVGNTQ